RERADVQPHRTRGPRRAFRPRGRRDRGAHATRRRLASPRNGERRKPGYPDRAARPRARGPLGRTAGRDSGDALSEGTLRSEWHPQAGDGALRHMSDTTLHEWAPVAPLEPLIDKCVHCGFCLPTCPSYLLLGQEMDSPRGRIYMMKAGVEGRLPMTTAVVDHFDTCLGCMACETACPSGVRYAPLVEETRAAIEHHHSRSAGDSLFRNL